MKIFRNGLVYVDKKDLRTIPTGMDSSIRIIEGREYRVFGSRNNLEYFKDRKDIVDYDSVHFLDENGLDEFIDKAFRFIEYFAKKVTDQSSAANRDLLLKKYNTYRNVYYNLLEYKLNKSKIDNIVNNSICSNQSSGYYTR